MHKLSLYRLKMLPFHIFISTIIFFLFLGCNEKDDYYKRPEWLEPPIYKLLEQKGNFKSFLHCIDKAGYKDVLSRAGYFTVFAPNDEAFQNFLSENAIADINNIDTLTAQKIVRYAMVYNVYAMGKLDDYQSTRIQGWIPDVSFKRRTAYYKWVYDEEINGQISKVIDINGAVQIPPGSTFNADDNNNKHIPYFTSSFMNGKDLTSNDYNYFFPDATLTEFNVVDARVIEKDQLAENGIVHVTDKVILPLPNLEEYLAGNPEYSLFKELIDKYMREYFEAPQDFLARYESYAGLKNKVYIKHYYYLNYPLNCENFLKYGGGEVHDAQIDGWTLFVPTNNALQKFYDEIFNVHLTLDQMSPQIISEFVNAHLFRTTVWPSKFATTTNYYGEPARFNAETDVIENKIGSNGIFYGVNKIQETDAFYTLLGDIILNPNYSLMTQALLTTELYYVVKNPAIKMTVFMIPNSVFEALGFSYDAARNTWTLDNPALGTQALFGLNRLMNLHIIINKEINDLNKQENTYVKTYNGEYIGYGYNRIWASGNLSSDRVFPSNKKTTVNGISYTLNNAMKYTVENVGAQIEGKSSFNLYYKYLQKAAASSTVEGYVYNARTKAIANITQTDNNTILIPNDVAMQEAFTAGLLPNLDLGWGDAELTKVLNFISYNMVAKVIVINDGEITGERETWFKTIDGKTYLTVINENGSLSFRDRNGRTANVVPINSYVLANRAIIHQIDNYLSY